MDKELLQRYVEGNASREEAEAIVDWLDQDEAHVREFMALHKLYDISLFNNPVTKSEMAKIKSNPGKKVKRVAFELLKIAAAFLVFALISPLFPNKVEKNATDNTAYQTLFIPAGQRAELTLPDSTKVWLNAKTKLIYPVDFGKKGNRTVTLDGEAYFDVRRNEKRPFIVKTKTMDVKVLGTEFNILAYSNFNTTEVSLLKGAININPTGSGKSKKYTPNVNEQVTQNNHKVEISRINDFDYFKWKEGLLCFNNETVSAIIKKLQLYFDIKIDVQKQELLQYRYTGKFRTKDGVEQVLKVLQLEHKFVYKRDQEQNLITIK